MEGARLASVQMDKAQRCKDGEKFVVYVGQGMVKEGGKCGG